MLVVWLILKSSTLTLKCQVYSQHFNFILKMVSLLYSWHFDFILKIEKVKIFLFFWSLALILKVRLYSRHLTSQFFPLCLALILFSMKILMPLTPLQFLLSLYCKLFSHYKAMNSWIDNISLQIQNLYKHIKNCALKEAEINHHWLKTYSIFTMEITVCACTLYGWKTLKGYFI